MENKLNKFTKKVSRIEVINYQDDIPSFGRAFVKWNCKNIELQLQDDDRTLKIFITPKDVIE